MVAKVEAYVLAKESLQLISENLSYRKQKVKIGSACSDWANIIGGIPQGSYLDFYFPIFLLMTFFLSLKSLAFVISQMITLYFPMAALFPKLCIILNMV